MATLLQDISSKYLVDLKKIEVLDSYLDAVIKANKIVNLTSINNLDEGRIIHIEDSISGYYPNLFLSTLKYADIGSGCGFPGVVNGFLGSCETKLIDSSNKKMRIVQAILDSLSIGNIETIPSRIEELPKEYLSYFDVVSCRALSSLSSILELASPLLKINGVFIAYKGNIEDSEFNDGMKTASIVGFSLINQTNVRLINGSFRTILYFRKSSEPSVQLPRRNGLAQKRPLK